MDLQKNKQNDALSKRGTGGQAMTEFEKGIFVDNTSMYRVQIYLCKIVELIEMANLMTDEDKKNLEKVCDMMGYETFEDWRRASDA